MFSKISKLATVCRNRQFLRSKSAMRSVQIIDVNHKSLQPNYSIPFSLDLTSELRKENAQFMLVFPDIIRDLTDFASKQYELRDAASHFVKALEYNVPHGKKIRGLTAVIVYKSLIGKERQTPENIRQAHIIGWCIELLQSVFLMSDDMVDRSLIRRNKPCWYKVDDVQSVAVNDILMIENANYLILKRYFGHLPCYADMIQLFHRTAMNTFIGQSLDYQMEQDGVTRFSMEKHICISNYKTSHFAFYTPIALPMMLAGYNNEKMFADMKQICCELGHFYQVQNDFLDCFSDSTVSALKKPGTDIEDGKCTWLAVKAMENGSEQHKAIMKKCYGKNDPDCVNQVKQVYIELDLPKLYGQYEEETYKNIKFQIGQFSQTHAFPADILIKTLDRTFNRI